MTGSTSAYRTGALVMALASVLASAGCSLQKAEPGSPVVTEGQTAAPETGAQSPAMVEGRGEPAAPQSSGPTGSLQAASAFLNSITTDLSGRSDAEIAEVGHVTYKTWADGNYESPKITTPEMKAAAAQELKAIGVETLSGDVTYDPVQKSLWSGGVYVYWVSASRKPFGLEDKADERRLGRPAKNQVKDGLLGGTCSLDRLVRIADGKWASVRNTGGTRDSPWVMDFRNFGVTPVKVDPNKSGQICLPAD